MDAQVVAFIVFTYGLSIALSLVIWLTGGHESPFLFLNAFSMFIPATAVVALRFKTGEKLRVDWGRPPRIYLLLALFLMPVTMHFAMLSVTVYLVGEAPWQDWLADHTNGVFIHPHNLDGEPSIPLGLLFT